MSNKTTPARDVSPVSGALETLPFRVGVSCEVAAVITASERVKPLSSLTNYVGGRVLNPDLPAETRTTWGVPGRDGGYVVVLWDVLDSDGCRHFAPGPGAVFHDE